MIDGNTRTSQNHPEKTGRDRQTASRIKGTKDLRLCLSGVGNMKDPLVVKLEAKCHTHKQALELESILSDLISNNDLAGELVSECHISYTSKEELDKLEKVPA